MEHNRGEYVDGWEENVDQRKICQEKGQKHQDPVDVTTEF